MAFHRRVLPYKITIATGDEIEKHMQKEVSQLFGDVGSVQIIQMDSGTWNDAAWVMEPANAALSPEIQFLSPVSRRTDDARGHLCRL